MLVLTRKQGQKILIGDNIVITVTAVDRGNVRLGFDAPPDVMVLREEIAGPLPTPPARRLVRRQHRKPVGDS